MNNNNEAQLELSDHMAMIFSTPLVAYNWPDSENLNRELTQEILKREASSKGVQKSNIGGWHSEPDFFRWKAPCINKLFKRVNQITVSLTQSISLSEGKPRRFKFKFDAWANVNRDRGYNTPHNHPNCLWSGVYYIARGNPTANGDSRNGKLELLDPRAGANMAYLKNTILESRYVIDPIPGLMVVFPSWLTHQVHPFHGSGERISVAFNVIVEEELY
ncbi:TIGR02466 family protein [Alteromonas sp. ASW11-130]|uniref:TIGR02466 family protein n=1 Tax=Alteromonas sp. ASW11-130 TaxID=3015775 RepID=UPI0022426E4F|nr:TIGR02466 family protein [Alteromonas sp. ASW11-130]MCW8092966.1 2OG-Fe(II) oxygenase family protein [Alteromonas sp. ASW11-130]